MVRDILQIGNPILYKKSAPVAVKDIPSKEIQTLIQDMLETCAAHDEETAGLSGVQIGEPTRIFIIRRVDLESEPWEVCINPELEIDASVRSTVWEGCLSIGTGAERVFGPVERPDHVKMTCLNEKGEQKTVDAKGYLAHIILHEFDHLEGKLFLQYIADPSNIWRSEDLDEYLEENGTFPPS
ncbi:MAG: peptide deformylase [Candidatus Doudnabacteria bacterium]|nr:peptide deformylase [Candidatus Doudnabacteria bacterium]